MSTANRVVLGLAAVVCLALGVLAFWAWDDEAMGGVLLRVGAILGAAWLAAPLMRRPTLATAVLLGTGALVMVRPRLLLPLVVAVVVWRISSSRTPKRPPDGV